MCKTAEKQGVKADLRSSDAICWELIVDKNNDMINTSVWFISNVGRTSE
jgi:hypothetical protein